MNLRKVMLDKPFDVIIVDNGGYSVNKTRRATRHYFKVGSTYRAVAKKDGDYHKFYVETMDGSKYQIMDEVSFKRVLQFDDNHCALSVLEGDSPW